MAETPQNFDDSEEEVYPVKITMKVDAPAEDLKKEAEDNEKNADAEQKEKTEGEEFKMCTPATNSKTTKPLTSNLFTASKYQDSKLNLFLKRPQESSNNSTNTTSSSGATSSSTNKTFVLNPSRLNPFVIASNDKNDSKDNNKIPLQSNGETPKFVPLIQSSNSSKTAVSTTSTSATTEVKTTETASTTFVFGQNLQDRVVTAAATPDAAAAKPEKTSDEPKPSTSLNSNGTSEMLFSSAVKNDSSKPAPAQESAKEIKSLSESAREYEEQRANKRKYDEVEVVTGEESETNILNITCKLFAFDKASGSWQERGRGVLRLNDFNSDDVTHSRLVFRATGSLRVVLNTKIWAGMTVEKASDKSVRFTALDANGAIKVFLAMASNEDSSQLFKQIQQRVEKEIEKCPNNEGTINSGEK